MRQIIRLSAGGEQIRIRLSNTIGDAPITAGAASVALRDHDAVIDPGDSPARDLFRPAGGDDSDQCVVLSDPIDLPVANLAELAVSLYFPEETTGSTVHGMAFQTNAISSAGDFTLETDVPVETARCSRGSFTGVDVAVTAPRWRHRLPGRFDHGRRELDAGHRPSLARLHLADRLAASGEAMTGVLNLGIAGNRLLHPTRPMEYANFGLAHWRALIVTSSPSPAYRT
ncbi:MAG: hypothetical protein R2853_11045 [Thermomicrobiales bacterium]